jgi:hypothetical protein
MATYTVNELHSDEMIACTKTTTLQGPAKTRSRFTGRGIPAAGHQRVVRALAHARTRTTRSRCLLTCAPVVPGIIATAERAGDPLVGCVGLAVDAVRVDLQQDSDAVPGAAGDLGRGGPRS